jgi:hypothetical protein
MLSKIPGKYIRLVYVMLAVSGFILLAAQLKGKNLSLKDCISQPSACLVEWFYHLAPIIVWVIVAFSAGIIFLALGDKGGQSIHPLLSRRSRRARLANEAQHSQSFKSVSGWSSNSTPAEDLVNESQNKQTLLLEPTGDRSSTPQPRQPDSRIGPGIDPGDDRTQIGAVHNAEVQPVNNPTTLQSDSNGHLTRTGSTEGIIRIEVTHQRSGKVQEKILTVEALAQGKGVIGRHPSCDLVLNSPEVSRVHGRIVYLAEQFYFTDLGSTSGSHLNHTKVYVNQNCLLQPDDIISIGRFSLLVKEIELNGSAPAQDTEDAPIPPDPDLVERSIWHAEELKDQGLLNQSISEFVFQDKVMVEGLSLSRRFRQEAIDLWQAERDTGKFCLLVEYSDRFTIWQEKQN